MLRTLASFVFITMLIFTTVSAASAEENEMPELKVGMVAPDFTLSDENGVKHSLRDYLGKRNVALAFYPKDFTGG
jgi:cytochrome oxidase Cu insertion factor (SCO1/SenC/PrrC family)